MILGHLIPAGTGALLHQEAQVRIHESALREQEEARARIVAARADLLPDMDIPVRPIDPDRPAPPSLADLTPDDPV